MFFYKQAETPSPVFITENSPHWLCGSGARNFRTFCSLSASAFAAGFGFGRAPGGVAFGIFFAWESAGSHGTQKWCADKTRQSWAEQGTSMRSCADQLTRKMPRQYLHGCGRTAACWTNTHAASDSPPMQTIVWKRCCSSIPLMRCLHDNGDCTV